MGMSHQHIGQRLQFGPRVARARRVRGAVEEEQRRHPRPDRRQRVGRQGVRAGEGGTGDAKCGGNYASSLAAQIEANERGCDQSVFLDSVEGTYIEELGGMNLFFVLGSASSARIVTPELSGILPGYGMQRPNDWGLGFELRDGKSPHWTGSRNSARTFGHFGQAGTFLWVDPELRLGCVVLTDRQFGDWAKPLWPALSDALVSEIAPGD